MFEGISPETGFAPDKDSTGLRPLDWGVVAARLAASNELRATFLSTRAQAQGNFASFGTGAAKTVKESRPAVNPDALADGKDDAGMTVSSAIGAGKADSGDREF